MTDTTTPPLLATRDAAVDFLTTHRHGEDRKPCTYCASYYGDILDKLYTAGLLRDSATLADRVAEFDASDDYHRGGYQEPGYYAAIDRVLRLLRGEITDWLSPRTEEPS